MNETRISVSKESPGRFLVAVDGHLLSVNEDELRGVVQCSLDVLSSAAFQRGEVEPDLVIIGQWWAKHHSAGNATAGAFRPERDVEEAVERVIQLALHDYIRDEYADRFRREALGKARGGAGVEGRVGL